MLSSHQSRNTSQSHLNKFYQTFGQIKRRTFDGLIITGAPVEHFAFEEVDYWEELCSIMEWSKSHITSTLHICWGAQAGLYYHHGIPKYHRSRKLSGVYEHKILDRRIPIVRSMDDYIRCPHSRHTEVLRRDIEGKEDLVIIAESEEAGILLVMDKEGSQIFVQGHPEYDRMTLSGEYHRDLSKGMDPQLPVNYYPGNNPAEPPVLSWRNFSNTLYGNWLNFYVYQNTPYVLEQNLEDWDWGI